MESIFVKRHLELIAEKNKVIVAFAKEGNDENSYLEVEQNDGMLIITYYFKQSKLFGLKNYVNFFRFLIAHFFAVRHALKLMGKVDFYHIHILTRASIIPFFVKLFQNIPYFISEHSTLYLKKDGFVARTKFYIQKIIVRRSSGISAVSNTLKQAMLKRKLVSDNFSVIPNVIDDDFFYPISVKNQDKTRFLHVSRLDQDSKNILGLINSFSKITAHFNDIELHIVGGSDFRIKMVKEHIASLNIHFPIIFYGNLNREKLRSMYQSSDFLVAFSNYETQAIVNLEALMCGIPVIATKIPAIQEYLHERNSLLVNPGDESELKKCLEMCIKREYDFWDKEAISNQIKENFNKRKIRESFEEFYKIGLEKG